MLLGSLYCVLLDNLLLDNELLFSLCGVLLVHNGFMYYWAHGCDLYLVLHKSLWLLYGRPDLNLQLQWNSMAGGLWISLLLVHYHVDNLGGDTHDVRSLGNINVAKDEAHETDNQI